MTRDELIDARRRLGYTQQALGDALGVTRRHIGAMERDEKPITRTTDLAIRYLLTEHRGAATSPDTTDHR